MKFIKFTHIFILFFILFSCSKEDGQGNENSTQIFTSNGDTTRVLIVSEGQHTYGTGSLCALSAQGECINDIFRTKNSRPLGDIPQSVTKIGEYLYIPVNNSQKIEVIDSKSFKGVETIVFDKYIIPMYCQYLGGDSMVVSDQSSLAISGAPEKSSLAIIDLNHNTTRQEIRRFISLDFPTFQMALTESKLFVGGGELSVFDLGKITSEQRRAIKNQQNETIYVADYAKICLDSNGLVWVLSSNKIFAIDPKSEEVVHEISTSNISTQWASFDIDNDGRWLYFNSGNDFFRIDTQNPSTPSTPLFTHSLDQSYWTTYTFALTKEQTIMVSRVVFGSTTRGRIFEYDLEGNICHEYYDGDGVLQPYFVAGIFPHSIYPL